MQGVQGVAEGSPKVYFKFSRSLLGISVKFFLHIWLYGNTSGCISHGPSQLERAIFDPPQLQNPSIDFHET